MDLTIIDLIILGLGLGAGTLLALLGLLHIRNISR